MNTVEQWVLFLPVLWIFAVLVGDLYAGIASLIWIAGRVLFSNADMADPSKRTLGFLMGFGVMALMLIASLGMVIWSFFA